MSSVLTVESLPTVPAARGVGGSSRVRPSAGRPVVRDRRGPARPVSVTGRSVSLCPSPVARVHAGPAGVVRRVTAAAGLVLASAVAVFGLGLLADAAAASTTPADPAVPAVVAP